MQIVDVVLTEVTGVFPPSGQVQEERRVDPLDVYEDEEVAPRPPQPPAPAALAEHRAVFLEVRTDEGIDGLFGPVDGPHAPILRRQMRPYLLGRDPLAIEAIWDRLYRRDRHARSGYYMMAMSALDCALWDLKGKVLGQPVYRLLGGPTRTRVPAYASMLGFSLEPELLARRAAEFHHLGYAAQKWFFRWGPRHGAEGAARNVAMVRTLRETLGDTTSLMFDAFNSWDVPYAVEVGRRIAEYRPAWLEEPVSVDRLNALQTIRARSGVPIATG
ncbi:MAG: enolase C-terminal domain-like protein, partial [Armatimonadota bacterium]|nr:enolase C-terminal domain-like protein [Armatimonadota bacterium]